MVKKPKPTTRTPATRTPPTRATAPRRGKTNRGAPDPTAAANPIAADATADFEQMIKGAATAHYVLRLYVTGNTARSAQAVANIRSLCDEHLRGRYELEVIDIYQQPAEAQGAQIIAAPTLVKKRPTPPRRMIGNLSDRQRVLLGLDIRPQSAPTASVRSEPAADGRRRSKVRWVEI